eukprot:COSAG02_NODE_998_length_15331_cov_38.406119_17_plen_82_part_00
MRPHLRQMVRQEPGHYVLLFTALCRSTPIVSRQGLTPRASLDRDKSGTSSPPRTSLQHPPQASERASDQVYNLCPPTILYR